MKRLHNLGVQSPAMTMQSCGTVYHELRNSGYLTEFCTGDMCLEHGEMAGRRGNEQWLSWLQGGTALLHGGLAQPQRNDWRD